MSNVIKAMNIRYTQEKRPIDLNEEAEGFKQLFIQNLAKAEEIEDSEETADENGLDEAGENDGAAAIEGTELPEIEASPKGNHGNPARSQIEAGHAGQKSPERGLTEEEIEAIVSKERDEMLESVTAECEKLKADTQAECDGIIAETRESLEKERQALYDEAHEQGYNDGAAEAKKEYESLKQELEQKLSTIDSEYEKKVDELEPAFVDLTINLLEKLTGILVDDRRDLILHIIRQSMLGMENSNSYIIHVSKDDYDFVNSKKQDLLDEFHGNSIEVIEDPVLERAQCTIETDTRIFDCSLDVQLRNLIADIRLLAGE